MYHSEVTHALAPIELVNSEEIRSPTVRMPCVSGRHWILAARAILLQPNEVPIAELLLHSNAEVCCQGRVGLQEGCKLPLKFSL